MSSQTNDFDETATAGDEAHRRARVTAMVVASAMFMVALDSTVLLTALPRMARDFGVSATALSSTITIYVLVSAMMLPVSGWIGQRFGSRRVFTIAILGFTLSSVGCGLSDSLPMFLAMRMLQAAFGTLMAPVGNVVLLTITPRAYLVTAMAISSTPALVAPVVGPPLGGFITTYFEWPWVFFINLPIGLVGLVVAARLIPNIASEQRTPFDFRGFALTATFLCATISGFDLVSHAGHSRSLGALLIVAGAILGYFAWTHARAARHPIVPLTPMRYPCFFTSTIGAGSMTRIAFMGMGFTLPLMLQLGLGLTPFQAGLLLLAQNGGDLALKSIASRALRFLGFRTALISGSLLIATSILTCALLTTSLPFWLLFVIMIAVGMARSVHMTAMMALRFADMPTSEVGGATVLGNLVNSLSQAFAISGVAAVLSLLAGDAHAPSLWAFRITLGLLALLAAGAAPLFARLAKDAGAELTGTQRGLRAIREDA